MEALPSKELICGPAVLHRYELVSFTTKSDSKGVADGDCRYCAGAVFERAVSGRLVNSRWSNLGAATGTGVIDLNEYTEPGDNRQPARKARYKKILALAKAALKK